ncbi:MAG TPA: ElyC/SanA/YdcF family protein [Vicinamibacterales bacterium]|nr:ElyC/SanA/YdcF family protein [Vicinamibacterales bacterium]
MFRLFRPTRTLFLLLVAATFAGMAACVVNAGRMVVDPRAMDAAQPADAIVVLSGTPADRWLEAYELWREKRAPVIVLSPGNRDGGSMELERRGVHVPADVEMARDIMTGQMGVPPEAIRFMDGPLDNTAAEAEATRALAAARGWRRVIVVTSLAHTRRTSLAMRRALEPAGITVQVRGSRFDTFRASAWWQSRLSARWVLTELPKLAAYRLGLGE